MNILTTQEQDFVEEVVKTGNKTDAVVKAFKRKRDGYARVKGHRLITKSNIQKAIEPIVEQLERERQAIINRLPKVRSKAKYRDLMDGLDKTTKTIQLLTGGVTDNVGVIPIMEVFKQDVPSSDRHEENSTTEEAS